MNLTVRLLRLDACSVSDALDKLNLPGAVTGLAALTTRAKIAGPVRTVKLGPPIENAPRRHLGAGAIELAQRGDIIVVEHGRTDVSGWGGLLSRGAVQKGVAGIIVDGACRDIDEALELKLPVYARAIVPVTARGRIAEHSFETLVRIAGVEVAPGDLVIADGSGVVFVPQAHAEVVIAAAEDIFAREQRMAAAIDSGRPIGQVMGGDYEDLLKGKAS